jgi:hypothetical protein
VETNKGDVVSGLGLNNKIAEAEGPKPEPGAYFWLHLGRLGGSGRLSENGFASIHVS